MIKVRFAPSPTGPFSLGNARTALFNWLFVRHEGGQFILRIEDTDKARSKKEYEEGIIQGLKWLGLDWDGEIYHQSQRLKIYEKNLQKLLDENLAYYCFCTPEELEIERQGQLSQGMPPKYSGRCRYLKPEDVAARLKKDPAVIRFKVPDKIVAFHDLVRGKVEFNSNLIGDIVIAKNLQEPLYNFAAAVDDYEMKITQVIRGEDHISNTPKQILIQEALGFAHPEYAHLPLILGPDRKKLSKRFLDQSLKDYEEAGYLTEAMLNFLVLLGWHPKEDREVLNRAEMIKEFTLNRVQKAGAIFNPEKLDWLNGHYLRTLSPKVIIQKLKNFIPAEWLAKGKLLENVIEIEKERMKRLKEFPDLADFFFELPDYPALMLNWQKTNAATTLENLKAVAEVLRAVSKDDFSKKTFESSLMLLSDARGRGEIFWPLRAALSGREASPGPLDILEILGKDESLGRIQTAINKLS